MTTSEPVHILTAWHHARPRSTPQSRRIPMARAHYHDLPLTGHPSGTHTDCGLNRKRESENRSSPPPHHLASGRQSRQHRRTGNPNNLYARYDNRPSSNGPSVTSRLRTETGNTPRNRNQFVSASVGIGSPITATRQIPKIPMAGSYHRNPASPDQPSGTPEPAD